MDNAAQLVSAELVGSQRPLGRRRQQPARELLVAQAVGREQVGEDAHEQEQEHEDATDRADALLAGKSAQQLPESVLARGRACPDPRYFRRLTH